ncbi:hypothetical protein HPB50_023058 [Hyalomma asiaticum]|uniref:Uncharacterized protein n=1 Tax=Hyalomma asiaticum TaxID=266040 RepID=A0ACB7TMU1_HYAAI|nr:hypothetical protein HPB50_023058 [Hyalomma asiaticum]
MSRTAGSQPTLATANFIGPLLLDVWNAVFRYLDAESAMNMAEAVPELKSTAFSRTILRRVTFGPQTNEHTVRKFVELLDEQPAQHDYHAHGSRVRPFRLVEALRFTGCRTLPSPTIINSAGLFSNLRELYCVGCVVEPGKLFVILSQKLRCLETLQWSLFDGHFYNFKVCWEAAEEIRSLDKLEVSPSINSMYVEVAAMCRTVYLLDIFVARCGKLRSLHVHAMPPPHRPASTSRLANSDIFNILRIWKRMVNLETCKFSCIS